MTRPLGRMDIAYGLGTYGGRGPGAFRMDLSLYGWIHELSFSLNKKFWLNITVAKFRIGYNTFRNKEIGYGMVRTSGKAHRKWILTGTLSCLQLHVPDQTVHMLLLSFFRVQCELDLHYSVMDVNSSKSLALGDVLLVNIWNFHILAESKSLVKYMLKVERYMRFVLLLTEVQFYTLIRVFDGPGELSKVLILFLG